MPKPQKNRDPNRFADRFYDYLMAHRGEVLRYAAAALVTGLIQFILKRVLSGNINFGEMLPFALRFILLFTACKYRVYGEGGTGFFYTARQLMIGVMAILFGTFLLNYLTIFLVEQTGRTVLMNYIVQGLAEIFYFIVYQFLIFKEPKND